MTPEDFAGRITALQDNGHQWMDAGTTLAVAGSPTSDTDMLSAASALKTAAQQNVQAVPTTAYAQTDTAPISALDTLRQAAHTISGPPPIQPTSITQIQQVLLQHGYAKGLPSDGVWSPSWQSSYNTLVQDQFRAKQAGDGGTTSVSAHKAAHGILSVLNPENALNAVTGFVKSIPGDLRTALAHGVGGLDAGVTFATGEADGLFTGNDFSGAGQDKILSDAGQGFSTAAGWIAGKTAKQEAQSYENPDGSFSFTSAAAQTLNDVGTALLILPVAGEVSAGVKSVLAVGSRAADEGIVQTGKALITRSLADDVAQRSPGVVARKLFAVPTASNGARGLLGAEAGTANPLIARIGSAAFGSDQAGYYRLRTLLAQPYRIPLVNAAGAVGQKAILGGAALGTAAHLSQAIGGPTQESQQILSDQTFDPVNQRLEQITGLLSHNQIHLGINDLGLLLHGPLPVTAHGKVPGGASEAASAAVRTGESVINNVLAGTGHLAEYLKAVGTATGEPGLSMSDEVKKFGSEAALRWHVTNKVNDVAASEAAQTAVAADHPDVLINTEPWKALVGERYQQIMGDPTQLAAAHDALAHDTGRFGFRIQQEITADQTSNRVVARKDGAAFTGAQMTLASIMQNPQTRAALIGADTDGPGRVGLMVADGASKQDALRYADELEAKATDLQNQSNAAAKDARSARQTHIQAVGLGADTTQTASRASATEDRLQAIADQRHTLAKEALDGFLGKKTGLDITQVQNLFNDAYARGGPTGISPDQDLLNRTIQIIRDKAQGMAADLHVDTQHPEVVKAVKAVKDAGYKPVIGTGIGWALEHPTAAVDLGAGLTQRKNLVERMGLGLQHFTEDKVSAMRKLGIQQAINRKITQGKLPETPLFNAHTISALAEKALSDPTPAMQSTLATARGPITKATTGVLHGVFSAVHERNVQDQLDAEFAHLNPEDRLAKAGEIRTEMQARMALAGGITSLSRKQVVALFTDPSIVPWLSKEIDPSLNGVGAFSAEQAGHIADAITESRLYLPSYVTGAGHLDALMATGMGFMGSKLQQQLPDSLSSALTGLARIPSAAMAAQSRLRFQLSPFFDLRRIAKTNLKFGLEGVRPTLNPVQGILSEGGPARYAQVQEMLNKIHPETANAFSDASDRMLTDAGVTGLYSQRHMASWMVHDLDQQGVPLDDMRARLDHVFTYGDRTALERSLNTVFFPFSFEKSVYRNLSGYMLDRPAQAIILARAYLAYQDFSNEHPNTFGSTQWVSNHLPILGEVQRLNAFAHGISPGELGGINAPLLQTGNALAQAFLPINLPANSKGTAALKRLLPVISDVARVVNESQDQAKIGYQAARIGLHNAGVSIGAVRPDPKFNGLPVLNGLAAAETPDKQISDGIAFKQSLERDLLPTIKYNSKQTDATKKVNWPNDDRVPATLRNQPIDASTIGQMTQHKYPSFNPNVGAAEAQATQAKLQAFLSSHNSSPQYANLKEFATLAAKVSRHVNAGDRTTPALSSAQSALREFAQGQTDPVWKQYYTTFFARQLGPMDQVTLP